MRVLVTGGAGFIGSHVADVLVARGHEVCVVDNLSSGLRANVPGQARFEHVDICDKVALERVFETFRPQWISHQAAQISVSASVRDPFHDLNVNIGGSLNICECAVRHGVDRIAFASTGGAIYGEVEPGSAAAIERMPRPQSPYAVSKLAVEGYLRFYQVEHGLSPTILRYANVYGPRQDPHGEAGVVAIFFNQVLAGRPVQINARQSPGDEGCFRDYVYVADVVKANVAALERAGSQGELTLVNVGTGRVTSTRELHDAVVTALGSRAMPHEVVAGGKRSGDVLYSCLDPGKGAATDWVGAWTPLAKGLEATADWFCARTPR